MILGICGFGYSGSGAILDFLKEFENVNVCDQIEFSLPYKPDGLLDLEQALVLNPARYWSSDSAIRRFIKMTDHQCINWNRKTNGNASKFIADYKKEIIQTTWKGSTYMHAYQASGFEYYIIQGLMRKVRRFLENKLHFVIYRPFWPDKDMYYSFMTEDEFLSKSRKVIAEFIDSLKVTDDCDITVLDQPFAANDPVRSFKFFDSPKAIIVNRDPRDIYLLAKHALGFGSRFIPVKDVESFIIYYKGQMKSAENKYLNENILVINFEDVVYDLENTKAKIERFVGAHLGVHVNKRKYFDPQKSINNTQVWLKYPQYMEEIKRIEEELSDYLFDFSRFNKQPKFDTSSF